MSISSMGHQGSAMNFAQLMMVVSGTTHFWLL